MDRDILQIRLAGVKSLFFVFLLYILKIMEVGMDWDFSHSVFILFVNSSVLSYWPLRWACSWKICFH